MERDLPVPGTQPQNAQVCKLRARTTVRDSPRPPGHVWTITSGLELLSCASLLPASRGRPWEAGAPQGTGEAGLRGGERMPPWRRLGGRQSPGPLRPGLPPPAGGRQGHAQLGMPLCTGSRKSRRSLPGAAELFRGVYKSQRSRSVLSERASRSMSSAYRHCGVPVRGAAAAFQNRFSEQCSPHSG